MRKIILLTILLASAICRGQDTNQYTFHDWHKYPLVRGLHDSDLLLLGWDSAHIIVTKNVTVKDLRLNFDSNIGTGLYRNDTLRHGANFADVICTEWLADSLAKADGGGGGGHTYYAGTGLTLTTYTFGISSSYLSGQIHDSTVNYVQLKDSNQSQLNNLGYATPAWVLQKGYKNGTVTSVALALPSIFSVSGSPVTTSGTLTGTLATQTVHKAFMGGSTNQGTITPYFRNIYFSDLTNTLDTTHSAGTGLTDISSGQNLAYKITNVGTAGTYEYTTFNAQGQETSGIADSVLTAGANITITRGNNGGVPTMTVSASGSTGVSTFTATPSTATPLWTSSVSNPTTTPVLSFTITPVSVDKFLAGGTPNQSTAIPTYRSIFGVDLPVTVDTSFVLTIPSTLFNSSSLTMTKSGHTATGTLTLANASVRTFLGGGTTNQSSAAPKYRTLFLSDLPSTLDTTHSAGTGLTDISSGQNLSYKITNVGTAGTYEYTTFNAQGQETSGVDTTLQPGTNVTFTKGSTAGGAPYIIINASGGGGGGNAYTTGGAYPYMPFYKNATTFRPSGLAFDSINNRWDFNGLTPLNDVEVHGTQTTRYRGIGIYQHSTIRPAALIFNRSHGTAASPTAVITGDTDAVITFRPYFDAVYDTGASITDIIKKVSVNRVAEELQLATTNIVHGSVTAGKIDTSQNLQLTNPLLGSNGGTGVANTGYTVTENGSLNFSTNAKGYAYNHGAGLITWDTTRGGGAANTHTCTTATVTATTSTSLVMAGLACIMTPSTNGVVVVTVYGTATNTTNTDGGEWQIAYGTGSAPSNGAAATGTLIGTLNSINSLTEGAQTFCVSFIATGLSTGTAYWFDLQYAAVTGGSLTLNNVSTSLQEVKGGSGGGGGSGVPLADSVGGAGFIQNSSQYVTTPYIRVNPDTIKVASNSMIINGNNKPFENDTASGSATALRVVYTNIINGEQFNILYAKTTASNLVLTFPNTTTISQASHYVTSGLTETITSTSSGLFMIKGQRFGARYVISIIELIP